MRAVRIISVQAKDVYHANMAGVDYTVRRKDGTINYKRYINTLDYSLDLIALEDVYKKKFRRNTFRFRNPSMPHNQYCNQVINVNFNYSYKEYNKSSKNIVVKYGYILSDLTLIDSICVKDGEIIAIELGKPIQNDNLNGLDQKYFACKIEVDKKTGEITKSYQQKKNFKTLMNVAQLREYLYLNGFTVDGVKYIRWKRSSGSARVGKCLFVNQELYWAIRKWDKCGLDLQGGMSLDCAAFEGAVSLSLSSITDTIQIHPNEILVIDDYESKFIDTVAGVMLEDDQLVCKPIETEISNSIWDGQSLLDESLYVGKYINKSMLLLRNRFFKSAAFCTRIQKWFTDNNITEISQLNGFTLAQDISQIKLITTPSSIKYMKFASLQQWLDNIDSTFGIVKTDKPTHYFDGRMVQIHYQLLNTLQLSYEDVQELTKQSFDYIDKIREYPDIMRYHIKYPQEVDINNVDYLSDNEIVYGMMGINDKFYSTKYCQQFKKKLIDAMIRNLRRGHILVSGNYAILFGNGLEMLKSTIHKFNGMSDIGIGNVYCKKFDDGEELIGSRSPHINAGNIYLAKNTYIYEFDKYFSLGEEVVCLNSIGENILQKLNGADFDVDCQLLSNNRLLIETAKRNYSKFLVPTSLVSTTKLQRTYTSPQLADLDIISSVNKIGEIVNLSQELNSIYWQNLYLGDSVKNNEELYYDICKLAVLSGLEIDKTKREVPVNTIKELETMRSKIAEVYSKSDIRVKPYFFKMITLENGFPLNANTEYKHFHTTMDYLQQVIDEYCKKHKYKRKSILCNQALSSIISDNAKPQRIANEDYAEFEIIIKTLNRFSNEIKATYGNEQILDVRKDIVDEIQERRNSYMEGLKLNKRLAWLLLEAMDDKRCNGIYKYIMRILFGFKNSYLFDMFKDSMQVMDKIVEDSNGDIKLYNFKFRRIINGCQCNI